ncbi:hypothetical protein HG530_009205 [Fusarium avenaceum]|nr:hypothetical protein HG530_009205 [Fusarium avenaceum]
MFWTNRKSHSAKPSVSTVQIAQDTKYNSSPSVAFIENSNNPNSCNAASITTPNDLLPFIEAETIAEASRNDLLWIIIDNIVYDCTEFIHNHPGGARVMEAFRGSNCTWQFWRFHSEKDLAEFVITKEFFNCFTNTVNILKDMPMPHILQHHDLGILNARRILLTEGRRRNLIFITGDDKGFGFDHLDLELLRGSGKCPSRLGIRLRILTEKAQSNGGDCVEVRLLGVL